MAHPTIPRADAICMSFARGWFRFSSLLVVVTLLWNLPAPVGAQVSTVREQRLVALFSELSPRRTVQVVTPDRVFADAAYLSVGTSDVQLDEGGTTVDVDLGSIRGVSVQSGHWLAGTLWGLGSGLLVGSVTGLMINSFDCTTVESCNSSETDGAKWGGLGLGFVGGVTGFLIGKNRVYWKPIFP